MQVQAADVDERTLARMALALERRVNKNRTMRVKYSTEPSRFMDSELELNDALKEFGTLATVPSLYPKFVELGMSAAAPCPQWGISVWCVGRLVVLVVSVTWHRGGCARARGRARWRATGVDSVCGRKRGTGIGIEECALVVCARSDPSIQMPQPSPICMPVHPMPPVPKTML